MMQDRQTTTSLFPPVDVTAGSHTIAAHSHDRHDTEQTRLLRDILASQDRQNELLEELVSNLGSNQRQRSQELSQWKDANPDLVKKCRNAAETLSLIQTSYLESITDEVNQNADALAD